MQSNELAEKLNGLEYPLRISKDLVREAKASGLVIVYGRSDDLMEFEGAIYDEVGAYGGAVVMVDSQGIIPDFDQIDKNGLHAEDVLRDYFKREGGGKAIHALWCKEGEFSWTYKTDIPHETFVVMEDGKPYCRGIIFSLSDLTF